MIKKDIASIIFYTEDYKYVVFKYKNDDYAFPHQKLTEEDDNFCPPLGIARHILTQISGGFTFDMLSQEVQLPQNSVNLKKLYDPNDWNKLWMSYEYNEWCDQVSLFYFSESQINGSNFQIYYHKINPECFSQNMKNLGVKILFFDIDQLRQLQGKEEITANIVNSNINFQLEIQQQVELENQPISKQNTFLFIQNKPCNLKQILDKGIPNIPTRAIFIGLYKRFNQKWVTYNSYIYHLPTDEVLENSKAIIQAGSLSSAYEDIEWIVNYREWINKIYFKYPHLKFLSLCFGEQILAHSLNGKCIELEEKKQNRQFSNIKIDTINFDDSFFNLPYVSKLNIPKRPYFISKGHGDIVDQIDTRLFKVIASSEKYQVEVFIDAKDQGNKVLAFQGHPEYSAKWKLRKNAQFFALTHKNTLEQAYEMAKKVRNSEKKQDDYILLRQVCSSFLEY
ncbi:hypothetical protein ABPG74_006151 [Tetrahymena malaccensis]